MATCCDLKQKCNSTNISHWSYNEPIVNQGPATRAAKSEVKRARITADEYLTIRKYAEDLSAWVVLVMDLAVVTGQRVGDLCKMRWEDIKDDYLYVEQSKTGSKLALPTSLTVNALNISMQKTLEKCKLLLNGETIIASTRSEPLSSGTISRYFMRARKASELSFEGEPPAFHELRSLSDSMRNRLAGSFLSTFSGISRTLWPLSIEMTEGESGIKLSSVSDFILTNSNLYIATF